MMSGGICMGRVIKIKLQGLLQSYGRSSVFIETRDTDTIPTKSAIVGMLAGALGIDRSEKEEIAKISDCVVIYARLSNGQTVAGKMEDFQTIHGNGAFRVASGDKKKALPLVTKDYLMDTSFDVYVVGEDSFIDILANALQHPVYPLVLGRKCCSPATRVFQGVLDAIPAEEEKLCTYLW